MRCYIHQAIGEKYKEFLKNRLSSCALSQRYGNFLKLVELGSQIRQIHLLESPVVNEYITSYPVIDGGNDGDIIKRK
ncbi:MAG: hypothetical protein R3F25_03750 [Gammaproteobacteria bacterium]